VNLPFDTSLDDVLVKIRQTSSNPNVGEVRQTLLKKGPQAYKVATLFEIKNRETGEFHHFSLRIDHIKKTKKEGWEAKPVQSATLDGSKPVEEGSKIDEIEALFRFLHASVEVPAGSENADIHVMRGEDVQSLSSMLQSVPALPTDEKLELIRSLLTEIGTSEGSTKSFVDVLEDADIGVVKHFAAASRFLEYRKAYVELEEMINAENTPEKAFQKHLEKNPWMFGSEYSKLLKRRDWVRDESLDFMLRRTIDGYLEVVEIKKSKTSALFNYDRSHDSYYPSVDLSSVLGQCFKYLESLERERDRILIKDRDDALKIRARVIIGRDGDENARSALRNLNDHLHSMEVITYDQLLRIARRVLEVFYDEKAVPERTISLSEFEDDIPF